MLITFKAKVKHPTEEEMELADRDLGSFTNSTNNWVWRNTTYHVNDIYNITRYDKTKSIVTLLGGEKLLIEETDRSFNKRWLTLLQEYNALPSEEEIEEEIANTEEEEDSNEDDD